MRTAVLATCSLNQWAMDFTGNYGRILESIKQAKEKGASYRCGPELEITGYGCADHFYESDTYLHSWEVIAKLMNSTICDNIMIDVGMPVMHKNVAYNCRVIFLNKKVILIRPKKKLCDSVIYREARWFTAWSKDKLEDYCLPKVIQNICNQKSVPIGDAVIYTSDTCIGYEICEELWNPESSHIDHCANGVEIIVNGSGGFHEVGNTSCVVEVIQSATRKCGGVYVFANLKGCDGERVYYHGTSHITCNGQIVNLGSQFSLKDVEVVVAVVDLDDVSSYRMRMRKSFPPQTSPLNVKVEFSITVSDLLVSNLTNNVVRNYQEGEEISLGPACWLWDFLRRSEINGFFLALDGDIDSCSSALIIYSLCNLIYKSVNDGDLAVLADLRKIVNDCTYYPKSPKELCSILLVTCHMKTRETPSEQALNLFHFASEIGSNHLDISIDSIISAVFAVVFIMTGINMKTDGNNKQVKSALFSVKEQVKTVLAYVIAHLFLWSKGRHGKLVVVGSGNSEKSLMGHFVKYGSSCADVNPTGAISRHNLKQFLNYSTRHFGLSSLEKLLHCPVNEKLNCESEMENDMSDVEYQDVERFERLRIEGCGPYSAFRKWLPQNFNEVVLKKTSNRVKKLFSLNSVARLKVHSIAPCIHLGHFGAVNSYLDQRQIIYNTKWSWQFDAIDREMEHFTKCNSASLGVKSER